VLNDLLAPLLPRNGSGGGNALVALMVATPHTIKKQAADAIFREAGVQVIMPSTKSSITNTAPGIPANAQISTVTKFIGTGVPTKFAKASTRMPSIELTTRYLPYLFQIFSKRYTTIKTKMASIRNVVAAETSISL
jgi:hypothetical protein